MRLVEVHRQPTRELIEFAEGRLSDHLWLDLVDRSRGAGDGHGGDDFVAVRVADHAGTTAYAQISRAGGGAELETIGESAAERLDAADTALDAFATAGGGHLTWWVDDPDQATEALAAEYGLAPERGLHEMRRPLPHEQRATIATRAFRPGVDDEAWLRVNNRAFADHPEQGGWTAATLASRLTADWFDPEGFRLHEIERGGATVLAGFCWTKIHPPTDTDPELGEIYVIGVDPDFHGTGLGKQLTLAGLDSISDRGVTTADLYVDAGNAPAKGLYDRLGFHIHRTRTAFTGDVPPKELS